jgi:hypothetical protein
MAGASFMHSTPTAATVNTYDQPPPQEPEFYDDNARPNSFVRRPSDMLRTLANYGAQEPLELHDEEAEEYWEEDEEEDESRFINFSLLSHMAVQLRDKVPRGTHVKGSIPYPRAFTGKDIVVS